jgi:hypothetical protein
MAPVQGFVSLTLRGHNAHYIVAIRNIYVSDVEA